MTTCVHPCRLPTPAGSVLSAAQPRPRDAVSHLHGGGAPPTCPRSINDALVPGEGCGKAGLGVQADGLELGLTFQETGVSIIKFIN